MPIISDWHIIWFWILLRYILTHGLLFILLSTTLECGTWGLSFGRDSTLANSFICAFTRHQPLSETSFLFQRMHVSVVGQVGDIHDPFEGIPALESWKVVNLSTCNFIVECFKYICCAPAESRTCWSLNDLSSRSHSFPAKIEEYYICSLCII